MRHLIQVGVGSGGIVHLDLAARDERIGKVTLIDPDVFQAHNAVRHLFAASDSGQPKVELAARWLKRLRPDLDVVALPYDLLDPSKQEELAEAVKNADIGVCAADNELAKFHFDALMRKHRKPWTLGEVLSGGIAGWVHRFEPGEACYGCMASYLQRSIQTEKASAPNYDHPEAALAEARIPANKATISAIASLHALVTLNVLDGVDSGFSSLLLPLAKVDGVFSDAFKPFRFRIARSQECLICGMTSSDLPVGEDLDVALDQALARLAHE